MEEGELPTEDGEIKKRNRNECNKCHIIFSTTEFVFHRRNVHTQSKFVCEICDFKTNKKIGKNGMESHIKFHTKQKYGCKQCVFKSSSVEGIGKHLLNVHNEKPFECTECEFKYNTQVILKQHVLKVHKGIFYKCDQCDLKFTEKHRMIEHSNVIHEGLKYNCVSCEFTTKSKNALLLHIRTIHKGMWHICDVCKSKFKIPSDLVAHMQSKHERKTFVCNICNFWFDTQLKLSKHCVRKHGEAKYACKECDYKTNGKSSLTRHKTNKHTEQDFAILDVPETASKKVNSILPQSQSKQIERKYSQKNKDLKDKLLGDPSRWKQFVPPNYICRSAIRDLRINTGILDKFEHLAIFAPMEGPGTRGIYYPKEVLIGQAGPELLPMGLVPEPWIFRNLLKCEREASNFPLAIRSEGVFGPAWRRGKSVYWYKGEVLERWWPKLVKRWREYSKITQTFSEM